MYRYQVRKYIILFLWMIILTWWSCHVLWFDLAQWIVDKFKDDYDKGYSTEYLSIPYSDKFSKDPFWDALMLYEEMSTQVKVSWVQYLEQALSLNNCSMAQNKEWAILYYFVPEFRSELVRILKMEWSDFDSKIYSFDDGIILDYCTEFYNCITNKSTVEDASESKVITSRTPENIRTYCKEFFQTNYREWQSERKRIQNLEVSWLWNDKYYNATIDDSPYDVMTDMGSEWEISYVDVQKPITPVFYDLPMFKDSKDALQGGNNWGDEEVDFHGEVQFDSLNSVEKRWLTVWDDSEYEVLEFKGQVDLSSTVSLKDPVVEKSVIDKSIEDKIWRSPLDTSTYITPYERNRAYDLLVEWLWAFKFNEDESAYYWSLCEDSEVEVEPEYVNNEIVWGGNNTSFWGYISDATRAEYQEVVDYMMEAVNAYANLPEDKEKEIEKAAWNVNRYDAPGTDTAEGLEETAKGILKCYQSCKDLMIDQKLTCMLKCSCGEITSPIFNPEVTPGLWPIYVIRYCTVPSANPRFLGEQSDGTDSFISTLGKRFGRKWKNNWWSSWWWSSWWWGNWWWSSWWWSSWWWSNWWWSSWWWGSWWWSSWWWSSWWSSSNGVIWSTFHVGWTNIKSLEEWVDEILWVIEKLLGEWRLGVRTPERNYLDSSTQLIDFEGSTAYTIDWTERDVTEKIWEPTEESVERSMAGRNESWLITYHVANPLDNPATKNRYRLVFSQEEIQWDFSSSVNSNMAAQSHWYLDIAPSFAIDQSDVSNASRYAGISKLFSKWFDAEWDFWEEKTAYIKELDEIVQMLLAKR